MDAERELAKLRRKMEKMSARIAELEDESGQMSTVQKAQIELFEKMTAKASEEPEAADDLELEEKAEAILEETAEKKASSSQPEILGGPYAQAQEAKAAPQQMNNPRYAQQQPYAQTPQYGMPGQPYADAPFERQQQMRQGEFGAANPYGAHQPQMPYQAQTQAQGKPSTFADPKAAEEAAQGIIPGKDTLTIIPTNIEDVEDGE